MAWIPIYADGDDFILILEKLNADKNIAYIVSAGTNRWVACRALEHISDGKHYLWHIPGGPVKLFKEGRTDVLGSRLRQLFNIKHNMLVDAGWVKDPFKGWQAPHQADAEGLPFLGSSPNIIELLVQKNGKDATDAVGMSGFGWIGNRYQSIGQPAAQETVSWWRRLKAWVSKTSAAKIPSSGPLDGADNANIWAFPSAYHKIWNGMSRDGNS